MGAIKFLPKRTYGLEDVVSRISRWLLSAWPFLICDRMFLVILNLNVVGRIPSSFCLRQFMGLKVLFEEYQDVLYFWILNGII